MDNPTETAIPVGGEDVTSSQGEIGAVETQAADTEMAFDGGVQSEADSINNPWDTDERFKGKAPEDIWKSYTELEKMKGNLSQKAEVANLIEQQFGLTPEQFKQVIAQQQAQAEQQRMQEDPAGYALSRVETLEQQLALKEEEAKLNSFIANNPEYAPHREKLQKLALTQGIGFDANGEKSYEELANEWIGEAIASGQTDAYKKIEVKKNSQTSPVTSTPKRQISEEDFKNMSVAEMEALLPHADTSGRLY